MILINVVLVLISGYKLRGRPKIFLSVDTRLGAVEKVLEHGSVSAIQREMDAAIEHFTNYTALSLPASISTVLEGGGDVALDEKSIRKARGVLNDLIVQAQEELDEKTLSCKVFKEKNRQTFAQVTTDLSRLGTQIADLQRLGAEAQQVIQTADNEMSQVEETRDDSQREYNALRKVDKDELVWRKNDLRVAEYILRLTKCKGKKSFLSIGDTSIKHCERDGEAEAHFTSRELQFALRSLNDPDARQRVKSVLLSVSKPKRGRRRRKARKGSPATLVKKNAECKSKDANLGKAKTLKACAQKCVNTKGCKFMIFGKKKKLGRCYWEKTKKANCKEGWEKDQYDFYRVKKAKSATKAAAKGSSKPSSGRKQANKCSLGKPNCGRLHDSMSLMWGEMRDAVDRLEAKMRRDADAFNKKKENWNAQISMFASDKQTHNSQLAEVTANTAADTEEQAKKEQESRRLEREYKAGWAKCIAQMNEILFTKICGVKKVRGELHKKSKEVKPDDIIDCEVGDWVAKGCSVDCDDKLVGGVQRLIRDVIQQSNKNGIPCNRISQEEEIKCNQIPCPLDCILERWSGYTSCSKDCGGGVKTRSRDKKQAPKNGGAACDAQQQITPCNMFSCDRDCDLSEWTERPCTVACGGGEVVRRRHVKRAARANGKCPKKTSRSRYQEHACNTHSCYGDEECIAKQDVVVAVDGSGSVTKKGFEVLRDFAALVIRRFRGKAEDAPGEIEEAVRVGLVQFGNGALGKRGSISSAKIFSRLTNKTEVVAKAAEKLRWRRGFTNMAQAFSASSTLFLNGGRAEAQSTVIVISDGKPSFVFQTDNAVRKLRRAGTKVIMVVVKEFPGKDLKLMRSWASVPVSTNLIHIPGLKALKTRMDKYVDKVVVHSCSKTVSLIHEDSLRHAMEKQEELGEWMGPNEGEKGEE